MSQTNPLQALLATLFKSPPSAAPNIPSGNAPNPMDIISKLMQIHQPGGDKPQGQPTPPPGQMPGLNPQMIMQLIKLLGGQSQPMQVPDAPTQKVISPMLNKP